MKIELFKNEFLRGGDYGVNYSNIKEQITEFDCIYIPDKDKKEIYLLHDYNLDTNEWSHEDEKKVYQNAKDLNKSIFENTLFLK